MIADQTAGAHPAVQRLFADAIAEFEDGTTPEARCARDADKLDCLLRALEYRAAAFQRSRARSTGVARPSPLPLPDRSPTPHCASPPPTGSTQKPERAPCNGAVRLPAR
ncbi:HD domain-containing protein [Kitasatospora gansuensis]